MKILFKSRVKQHQRASKTGKLSTVKMYERQDALNRGKTTAIERFNDPAAQGERAGREDARNERNEPTFTFDRHGKKIKVTVPPRETDAERLESGRALDEDHRRAGYRDDLTPVKRADVVKQLVDDDMAEMEEDPSDLRKILENGHKGYKNMTDKELADFYEEQYGEAITIKAGKA